MSDITIINLDPQDYKKKAPADNRDNKVIYLNQDYHKNERNASVKPLFQCILDMHFPEVVK